MERTKVSEADHLEEDPELRGQKYVCLSFISPDDVIAKKDVFIVSKFIAKLAEDVKTLLSNIDEKFSTPEVTSLVKTVKDTHAYLFKEDALQSEYNGFRATNEQAHNLEYLENNNFQTCIRGIKVRGSYETLQEAKNRVENIQKFDKNFHVYVAQVGCWCPWSPNPEDISEVEYSETELNTLMKKYKEAQLEKETLYNIRKGDMIDEVKMHHQPTVSVIEDGLDSVKSHVFDAPDTWRMQNNNVESE